MDDYCESMAFLAQANAEAEAEAGAQAAQAEAEYEHEMFMQTQNDIINNSAGRGVFFDSKQLQFISDYVTAEIAKAKICNKCKNFNIDFNRGKQAGRIEAAIEINKHLTFAWCKQCNNCSNVANKIIKQAEAVKL